MAFPVVLQAAQNSADGVTSLSATFGSPTTAGSTIIAISVNDTGGGTWSSFSDNNSSTFGAIGAGLNDTNANHDRMGYADNITGRSGHIVTANYTGSVSFTRLVIVEVSGLASGGPLASDYLENNGSTTPASRVINLQDNYMFRFSFAANNGATGASDNMAPTSIWTEPTNGTASALANETAVATGTSSSSGPLKASWTRASSGDTVVGIAVFRLAAVSGGSTGGLVIGSATSFVGAGMIGAPEGASTQNLTLGLLTNTNSFFAPQLNLNLTMGLLTNTNSFFAPQLNLNLTLGLLVDNIDTFFSPTVTPGPVTLTLGLLDDSVDTFYSPTVSVGGVAQNLTMGFFDDSADTFYAPQLDLNLTMGLLNDSVDTFFAPSVTVEQSLALGFLDDSADTFFAPTVTPGDVTLTMGYYIDPDTFFSGPTVTGGADTGDTPGQNLPIRRRRWR